MPRESSLHSYSYRFAAAAASAYYRLSFLDALAKAAYTGSMMDGICWMVQTCLCIFLWRMHAFACLCSLLLYFAHLVYVYIFVRYLYNTYLLHLALLLKWIFGVTYILVTYVYWKRNYQITDIEYWVFMERIQILIKFKLVYSFIARFFYIIS